MANGNQPNLRFQGQVPFASIVDALRQRPVLEEQLRSSQEQREQQRVRSVLDAATQGLNLASMATQQAQRRQQQRQLSELSQSLQQQLQPELQAAQQEVQQIGAQPTPGPLQDIAGPTVPARGTTPQVRQRQRRAQLDPDRIQSVIESVGGLAELGKTKEAQELAGVRPGKTGSLPRSIESFFVQQAARGEISIKEAISEIRKAEPKTRLLTDAEGNQKLINEFSGEETDVTGVRQTTGPKATRREFTPAERKAISEVRGEMKTDPVIREARIALQKSNVTRKLIQRNRKGSIGFIRTQLAKAAGEQRITDQDIERFSGSPAIADRLTRKLQEWKRGNLTEEDRTDYLIMLDIAEKAAGNELSEILDSRIDGLEFDLENADRKALRKTLGRGFLPAINRAENRRKERNKGAAPESLSDADLEAEIRRLRGQ